jgi:hypothetical protein
MGQQRTITTLFMVNKIKQKEQQGFSHVLPFRSFIDFGFIPMVIDVLSIQRRRFFI